LHKIIVLYQVSFGYFHHTATSLKDMTIGLQEATFISWNTSPKLNTTKGKDPGGGAGPQSPTSQNRNLEDTDFIDTITSNVLSDSTAQF
jgi:hypothetical protein